MTTLRNFGIVLGWPLETLFGLSQLHGHGFWLVCEVASRLMTLIWLTSLIGYLFLALNWQYNCFNLVGE